MLDTFSALPPARLVESPALPRAGLEGLGASLLDVRFRSDLTSVREAAGGLGRAARLSGLVLLPDCVLRPDHFVPALDLTRFERPASCDTGS